MAKLKVVHYINQFFAQIGGEEKADYPAELLVGKIIGPGTAFAAAFVSTAPSTFSFKITLIFTEYTSRFFNS